MTDAGYSDVLVPTDGSDLAMDALDEALSLAEMAGATIHVLYVVDDATIAELAVDAGYDDVSFDVDVSELFERYESIGEQALSELQEAADERGVAVRSALRKGIPHEEILSYAEENGIDVIVMGTAGRKGVTRYVLGSTTERVLRRSPVPVLAVRGDD